MEVNHEMNRKKSIACVLVLIALVALTPLLIYGPAVTVASVNLGISITTSPTSSKSTDYYLVQPPTFGVALDYASVDITALNGYQYLATRLTGTTSLSGDSDPAGAIVEITITFNLTTPSEQSLIFTLNPISSQSVGEKHIQVILGPEAGISEPGEFSLSITITVVVTPPGFTDPVINLDLAPVDLTFDIP